LATKRPNSQDREEISALLTTHYPLVNRLAIGLVGDAAAAQQIARTVFTQSLPVLQRWKTDTEAANWFLHHTLLESRHVKPAPVFWAGCGGDFLRAWSALPFQQKEAFLLTHGEKLDLRRMAIAMDCSTTAAGNHLAAATKSLQAATGTAYEAIVQNMTAAYLAPPPPPNLVIEHTTRAAKRRRVLWRIAAALLVLLAAAVAYFGYRIYGILDY
jgi:DNA-directed RNA polymerase specialized sigma24 family protein